jgi:formylglycine-generating enzyme
MRRLALSLLLVASAVSACTTLLGNDFDIVAGVDASSGGATGGTAGDSGSSGTSSGASGASGASGVSGVSGVSGASGDSGASGESGASGTSNDSSMGSGGDPNDAATQDGSSKEDAGDGAPDVQTCDAADPTCRICQPGSYQCRDAALERCAQDGRRWEPGPVCASAPLCDATRGACVPPACQPNEHRCSTTGELQVCRATQDGFSFVRQCMSAGHCDAENARCNTTTCTTGTHQCSGARLERCNAGNWDLVNTCASSALCDAATPRCIPQACTPAQYRCVNANLERCRDDLTGWVGVQSCINQALCDASGNQCKDPVCQVGSHRCTGALLEICNADLTGYAPKATCASQGHCNASAGICNPTTCTTGQYQCSDNLLQRCNAAQTGWDTLATCDTAALCSAPAQRCNPAACAAGAYQCVQASLQVCNPGRTGYVPVRSCDSNALCDAVNGQCDICVAGSYSCSGSTLYRCSTDGQSNPPVTTCPAGATCNAQFGRCDTCPSTGRGPAMVQLSSFCIDSTEVTNAQYDAFLQSGPPTSGQPTRCGWNNAFTPAPSGTGEENFPVTGVDWCDAYAFCAWSGKRLCGRIGGGATPVGDFANSAVSQWYSACVSGSADLTYPYSDTYSESACNGGNIIADLVSVRSMAACHAPTAPFSGIYDMSGNADEWEDTCITASGNGAQDKCRTRGGAYPDSLTFLRCDADWLQQSAAYTRSERIVSVGFRCCAP